MHIKLMSAIRKLFGTNYIDSYYTKLYQVGFVESLSFLNACYLNFKLRVTWPGLPALLIHSVLILGNACFRNFLLKLYLYSEKATKFCEISTVDLTGTT